MGTIRDAQKWPKRDARKDPDRLDSINYNLLSPYTIQKMLNARKILENLAVVSGENSDVYSYQIGKIKNSALKKGLKYYEMAINKFLGNSLIKRLEDTDCSDVNAIRARMMPDKPYGEGRWVDLSGMIAPKKLVDELLDDIESGRTDDVRTVNERFADMHAHYYDYEWTWAYGVIGSWYGIDPATITREQVISIVEKWKESVIQLDRLVYEDARKEFSLSAMTGFGADGDKKERKQDFAEVRGGLFDSNPFVQAVLKHIEVKSALGDDLISRCR